MTAVASCIFRGSAKAVSNARICIVLVIALLCTGCATSLDTSTSTTPAEFMLTFDDGPLPGRTDRILDMLATLKAVDGMPVRAGFFLLGDAPEAFWPRRHDYAPYEVWTQKGSVAKYPDLARRIPAEGHIVGNHSTHHVWLHWPWQQSQKAITAEMAEWEAIAQPVLGEQKSHLFRPPYLVLTKNLQAVAQRMDYQIVMGEATGDTTPLMSVSRIKRKLTQLLQEWDKPYPCVLVFHDIRPATYKHLDEIVSALQQQGFRLVHFEPARLVEANELVEVVH